MQETKNAYAEEIAANVIKGLQNGTAPFIVPWEAGTLQRPHNPLSGTVYRGANWAALMMQERQDPRWATYKQAAQAGWQVRKGEKATTINFYTATRQVKKLGSDGQPILDEKGKAVTELIKLQKPIIWSANVFNAEQMDNVPPLPALNPNWNEVERLEKLLENSNVKLFHDQQNRAFYSQANDSIHLPQKAQFPQQVYYYETVLHELGHWTGHSSRLDRDLKHPFGSPEYAREELRAELASYMLAQETGISHGIGRTTTYVESWIKVLQDDPQEIILAAKDAEKITQFVLQFDKELAKEQGREQLSQPVVANAQVDSISVTTNKLPTYTTLETMRVKVPYVEKDEFKAVMKAHGAKAVWDSTDKEWRVPSSVPKEALAKWLTPTKVPTLEENIADFSQRLTVAGLVVNPQDIKASGEITRVPVEGARPGSKDGAFALYTNNFGRIAGWFTNFKTGEHGTWGASGQTLSKEQRDELKVAQLESKFVLKSEIETRQNEVANSLQQELLTFKKASPLHPYLVTKGVTPFNALENDKGALVLPLRDTDGKAWSTQTITNDGKKRYQKGGKKQGLFVLASEKDLEDGQPIVLAEGYATARTAAMAATATTLACLDVYNLEAVALDIRAKFPNSPILIIGDDDAEKALNTGVNIGRTTATEVAEKVTGVAIFPEFKEQIASKDRSDFNDLAREEGLGAVIKQVNQALEALSQTKQKEVAHGR